MLVYQRVNVTTYSSTMDPMGNWGRVHTTNEGVSKQTMRVFFTKSSANHGLNGKFNHGGFSIAMIDYRREGCFDPVIDPGVFLGEKVTIDPGRILGKLAHFF